HPEEEYLLRWVETERVCNDLGIKCHLAPYELDKWLNAVKGLEDEPERGKRCSVCHDLRLEKTAQFAKENGFDAVTTVLMMSPKKDFQVLKDIGEKTAEKYGLQFISIDFRKNGGIEKMNRLSKKSQLYHQNYCGCMYALFQQREGEYIKELVSYGKGRLPGSREELLFIKQIRAFAESLGLPCMEESFNFVNWRVVHSTLKINKQEVPHSVLWFSRSVKGVLRSKVEDVIYEDDKKVALLGKYSCKIWILNRSLKDISLEVPRVFTEPILIVGSEYRDIIDIGTKVEIRLKTEFDENGRSQNLIIGNPEAVQTIEYYSDTLPDGKGGYSFIDIKGAVVRNLDKIQTGDTKVVVYGAKTAGNLGKMYMKKALINI
ncbi:MAG TPA: epoxyqueuosine reductase QueH, partial [Persephonella sp.]|nr:epoxyqueuosine reductase QueH [Persephonella sp.]